MPNKPIFIGIDLGTSNSATAVWREDLRTTATIKDLGFDVTPSVVAFNDEGERLVGVIAKDQQKINPRNTVHGVKQIIGRRFTDREVALAARHWPFPVASHKDGTCRIQVATKAGRATLVRPEEISAAVLSRLAANAATRMHAPVEGAVITVPANFNHQQRVATKNAATIAGIKVLKLMNEPSAAAYAYGATDLDADGNDRHMLIFDLGGGTLDLAVLYVPAVNANGDSESGMKIKAVDADLSLGGDTFTGRLAQYCLQELPAASGFEQSMFVKPLVKHMIYKECENVKQHLSFCRTAAVNVQLGGDASAQLDITRDVFEELCREDFQRIYQPLERVLAAAKLQRSDISRVLLVGGSTRIPAVHAILTDFFGSKIALNEQVDVNVAVAHGAAIEAARISGTWKPPIRRWDSEPDVRQPTAKGLASRFGRRPKLDTVSVPVQQQQQKLPPTQLPPKDVPFEVLPHTLSVVYNQGECCPMLLANTPYPASSHESFDKQWPDQDSITVSIMEGPSLRAKENRMLERFEISGLRHLRQGVSISFHVNKSGIMEVSAQALEDATKAKRITVHALEPAINHATMVRLKEDEARLAQVDVSRRLVVHPAPLPLPPMPPAASPEMVQALRELDDQFRHQQVSLHSSPDSQRHIQLIREDFMRMSANGEILTLADVKDIMHRLIHIPVPGPGGDSICAVHVG